MHRNVVRQITAWSGMFSLAAVILTYLLVSFAGADPLTLLQHFPDVLFPGFADQPGRPVIFALWSLVAGNLFLFLFFIGLEQLSDPGKGSISFISGLMQAAMIISMLITLFTIGLLKGMVPVIQETEKITPSLRGSAQTMIAFRNYSALFAGLLVSAACFVLGNLTFRKLKARGSWLLVAGMLLGAGTFWPLLEPLGYLRNLGFLMFLLWAGHSGLLLLISEDPRAMGIDLSEDG